MNLIGLLRITTPLFSILLFFFYYYKNIIIFFQEKKFHIYYSFIFYILANTFFVFLDLNINSYLNIYWGILMLVPLMCIYLCQDVSDQLKILLASSLLILFAIFIYYFSQIVILSFIKKEFIHLYGISDYKLGYYEGNNNSYYPPRSSGLSRMSIILYISLTIFLIVNKNKLYIEIGVFLLSIIFGTLGLTFQSRTMNFIFVFFAVILILIYFRKKNLKNNKYIFFLIIIPIILSYIYLNFSFQNTNDPEYLKYYKNSKFYEKNSNLYEHNKDLLKKVFIRDVKEDFSSNRFKIWDKIINVSKKNIFIGYGFQADRKIINESAHSVYLYSLICGGLISLLIITFISLRAAWVSFIILVNFIFLRKDYHALNVISAFLTQLFLLRGILETSYGIYSLDYLLFIICYFINERNYKKNYLYKTFNFFDLIKKIKFKDNKILL